MTDTTDIKALREIAKKINHRLDVVMGALSPFNPDESAHWDCEKLICDLISQLEAERQQADYGQQVLDQRNAECDRLINELKAERQRADDAHKYGSERDSENESLMLTVGRLRVEIAELKGDQKPYGYYSAETETILEQQGHASISAEPLADSRFPLFTAPQKPVVTLPALPTTPIVPTQPFSLHDIMRATRNMDIKAIEAAGGIVSTSDQRLMQDMSGIVQDGE